MKNGLNHQGRGRQGEICEGLALTLLGALWVLVDSLLREAIAAVASSARPTHAQRR